VTMPQGLTSIYFLGLYARLKRYPHPNAATLAQTYLPISSDSLGNTVVHSLLVTLGNHAIPLVQPYNCPCPIGHSLKRRLAMQRSPGQRF